MRMKSIDQLLREIKRLKRDNEMLRRQIKNLENENRLLKKEISNPSDFIR
jgi:cell division protein FtsB